MKKTPKIILLSIVILLNLLLLSIGTILVYDLVFPPTAKIKTQSRSTLGPEAKARISEILNLDNQSPDHINVLVFTWMKNNDLIYASVYDETGKTLFRNYHPGKLPQKKFIELKKHFKEYRLSKNTHHEKYLQFHIEVTPVELYNANGNKNLVIHTAKSEARIHEGIYNRWTTSARKALQMIFGGASVFIALALVFIGSFLVFSCIQEIRKIKKEDVIVKQKGLSLKVAQQLDASMENQNDFLETSKELNENTLDSGDQANEQMFTEQAWEFKQERWNLPGFLSVMNPIGENFYPEEPLSWQQYFSTPVKKDLKYRQSNHFDFQFYRFESTPEYPTHLLGLERFSRIFLERLVDVLPQAQITLMLKNRKKNYEPVLLKKGNLFVSGDAICQSEINKQIQNKLEKQSYVLQNDGKELYFPLPTRKGIMGIIYCQSEQPLYNKELLSRLWFEIRKFGESLYQIKIFEQATIDPVSCLGNGMSFYKDLEVCFHLKKEVIHKRQLMLMQFIHPDSSDQMHWIGTALRAHFHSSIQIHRIAADVCTVMGSYIPEEVLTNRIAEFMELVQSYFPCDISIGIAILENEVASPNEWFQNAAAALEECRNEGANRYQYYKNNRDSYQFVPSSF